MNLVPMLCHMHFGVIVLVLGIVMLFSFGINNSAYSVHDIHASRGVDDPKIAVDGSGVYVVWPEGSGPQFLDLFFAKSTDNGKTFDEPINLTNGSSFYPDPKIIVAENNVYIVWEDRIDPDGIDAIYFTKSNDGGNTFDKPRIMDPVNDPENLIFRPLGIIESNDVVYIFANNWDRNTKNNNIIVISSNDFGNTFSEPKVIFEFSQWDEFVDFEVDKRDGTIYVMADDGKNYDEKGELLLRKILPNGTLSEIISVNGGDTAVTFANIAVSEDNVYAAWRAWENDRWHFVFVKSHDRGETFSEPSKLNSDPESIDIHGSQGSSIFAHDDFVYVKWNEVYWDGKNQTEKIWYATSDNLGGDFEVKVHPLNDLLNMYGDIITVKNDSNLYSMAMTTKNPPYGDGAIYVSRSNDGGKSFAKPVDVLESNPPAFRFPDIATQNDSIYFVAKGDSDTNCILYTASHDLGGSFEDMKNLSPNGTPKECLGIIKEILPPNHQIKSGVEIEDVRCNEERSKGYVLALRQDDDMQPICVTAASYDRMLDREIISDKSFETIALNAAKNYLLSHPKLSTKIVEDSLKLEIYMTRHSVPPAFIIKGSFESNNPIYDGDKNPLKHTVEITLVQNNIVHLAEIDDTFLLTESEDLTERQNPRDRTIVSPTIGTILSPGDRVNNKGLIPLLITEVSQGGYPDTTHWTFQSIGYHGDNRDKLWGFLPDPYRISETVDQNGNDAIDRERMPENFGIPMPLFVFPLLCNGEERVEGESGWHYTLPTRTDTDTVYFRSTDKGIYPDENGIYDIKFVSMFKPKVELLPNTEAIINETVLCPFEKTMNDATHAYYTHLQYKIVDEWTTSYYSPESGIIQEGPHAHATILVKVFGDKFDFSQPQFHLKDPKINLEPAQPDLIHRNSKDATIGLFFETLGMNLNQECFVFPDGRDFCNDDEYVLKFYVNDERKGDISQYVITEDDRIFVSYGPESSQDIEEQLAELESMAKYNYFSLDNLMTMDVGTVRNGTYNGDLGFKTAEKLMMIEMNIHSQQNIFGNEGDVIEYTSEEIFERIGEIEAENIKMYKFGPEVYAKYVLAKETFEDSIKNNLDWKIDQQNITESIPLVFVEINSQSKIIEIILQKDLENNPDEIELYASLADEVIPKDIPWEISFSS